MPLAIMTAVKSKRQYWYRWMKDEEFRQALTYAHDTEISHKVRRRILQSIDTMKIELVIQLFLADKPLKVETKDTTPPKETDEQVLERMAKTYAKDLTQYVKANGNGSKA